MLAVVAGWGTVELAGCTLGESSSVTLDGSFSPFDAQGEDSAVTWSDGALLVDAPVADHSIGSDAGIDAPSPDDDGGTPDATPDASSPFDAGTPDAPSADAAIADTGADAFDAGLPLPDADAAIADTGADTGLPDTFVPPTGCADGTREGFLSATDYPAIAACAGAWSVPGVTGTPVPTCGRAAGNAGTNASGAGCSAADLCAVGWHICAQAGEVAAHSPTGCAGAAVDGGAPVFYASGQSGPGNATCGAGSNDLFGCGTLGEAPAADCSPLDRFGDDLCSVLGPPWMCGTDETHEADDVTKTDSTAGGVLCCSDP